jgi:hypothetical protein
LYCWIAPPEPRQPIVCTTAPYSSTKCSLVIIAASAEIGMLQLLSRTFRLFDATAYPWLRNKSCPPGPAAEPRRR